METARPDTITPEDLLVVEEGFRPSAYKDSEGFWTIGFGCLIDERAGGGITEAEGYYLLRNRIAPIYPALDKAIPWWREMNDTRRAVVVSMAYQMGVSGLMKFRRTLRAMQAGDYAGAAKGMRSSLWFKQTPGRAKRAARAMESGTFDLPDSAVFS